MKYEYSIFKNDIPADREYSSLLAIDCEMMGLNINRDRLCVAQIFDPARNHVDIIQFTEPEYNAPNLKALLSSNDTLFLGHMIRLDLAYLYKYLGVMPQNVFCSRTASRIGQTYGASHNYLDLVSNLLGEKIDKSETSSYWGAETLSDKQIEYVCQDVVHLPALKEKLEAIIANENRQELANQAMKMIPTRAVFDAEGWWNDDILSYPF